MMLTLNELVKDLVQVKEHQVLGSHTLNTGLTKVRFRVPLPPLLHPNTWRRSQGKDTYPFLIDLRKALHMHVVTASNYIWQASGIQGDNCQVELTVEAVYLCERALESWSKMGSIFG